MVLEVRVVEVDVGAGVPGGGQRHDPRVRPPQDRRRQQRGQQEVAEVVRPELGLEAVGGATERAGHHPGVVDQHVDGVVGVEVGVGERTHAGQVAQVDHAGLDRRIGNGWRELGQGSGRPLLAAGQHGDRRAVGGERPGALTAEAGGGAGDDDPTPGQVDPLEHLVGGRALPVLAHLDILRVVGRDRHPTSRAHDLRRAVRGTPDGQARVRPGPSASAARTPRR